MRACFYTFLTSGYSAFIEVDLFIKSLKHFHPDVPLIIFDQAGIDYLVQKTPGVDMFKIKATAAKALYDQFDLVINGEEVCNDYGE